MKKAIFLMVLLMCIFLPTIAEGGFDETIELNQGYFFGKVGDQWKLYNADGSPLLDYFWSDDELYYNSFTSAAYSDVDSLPFTGFQENGLAKIRFGNVLPLYGAIDRSGNFVVQPFYDFISNFEDGAAIVVLHGKEGLIHESGAYILPPKYDVVGRTDKNTYSAESGSQTMNFYVHGSLAVPCTVNADSIDMDSYLPHTGAQTPALDEPATLQLTDSLPRLDGATALFPLYCGLAQAVYPDAVCFERTEEVAQPVLTFTNTPGSYYRLIHGQCDLIFVAQPSDEQLADAAEAGVELELTPIATEAFVFFVNGENPLEGLTVDQIREIYSGKITSWDELGVSGIGDIVPYQRPKNSGSQTALENLMGDVPLMEPLAEEDDGWSMGGIVEAVGYRNTPDALGYSFRFFLTTMMDSDVNLLALDGVKPTEQTISDGSYPIIAQIYAVSRKGETSSNVQAVIDWLRSEQGKELIRRSGYVPIP